MKIPAWAKRLLAVAALWLAWPAVVVADDELRFGVFPSLAARVIVEGYQPLANGLADSIRQPVNLESAPDFTTFHKRTMAGEYDLVLTAPHLAWLAWKEGGYRPLLSYTEPVRGLLIVRADSPYRQLADLRGKTVAMPDPLAIVFIRMKKILQKEGLLLGRELTAIETGSHTNAATHVNERQADAAVLGMQAFQRLPQELRDNMWVIAETPAMPGQVFLVHTRITPARQQAIRRAIEQFTRTEAGREFLRKGGFGGVRTLKKNELKQVEGDAMDLKQRLQAQARPGGPAQ